MWLEILLFLPLLLRLLLPLLLPLLLRLLLLPMLLRLLRMLLSLLLTVLLQARHHLLFLEHIFRQHQSLQCFADQSLNVELDERRTPRTNAALYLSIPKGGWQPKTANLVWLFPTLPSLWHRRLKPTLCLLRRLGAWCKTVRWSYLVSYCGCRFTALTLVIRCGRIPPHQSTWSWGGPMISKHGWRRCRVCR